jgi:ATP-dependent Clp protease ATP-binding subunit ClpA
MKWFQSFWKGLNTPMGGEGPEFIEPVGNFTPRAQQVLNLARQEAKRLQHNFVGTEHVLLGLIRLGQGTAVRVLGKMGLDLDTARCEVEKQVGRGPEQKISAAIPYTPRVNKVLSLAAKEAKALNHTYVGTEHILLGLLREGDGVAGRVLKSLGLDIEATRQNILRELDPNFSLPSAATATAEKQQPQESQRGPVDISKRYDVYCREANEEVVYRNALFKRAKTLLREHEYDILFEYLELEDADGRTVFVARSSVVKFCEHVGDEKPH